VIQHPPVHHPKNPILVKAELGKIFSISPKLLVNAELYGLVLAPKAEKKETIEFGKPMFEHLLNS